MIAAYDKYEKILYDLNLIYKTINELELPLHVYMPRIVNQYNRVPIICIHGGGWHTGVQKGDEWNGGDMLHQARYFAKLGYIGITISYRSLDNSGTDILDLIEDCKDAITYVKNNFNFIDDDKIVLIGDSAGGHLAACLGITEDDTIRPAIVVACNPVLDCRTSFAYASEKKENRLLASPLLQMPKKCAHFLLMHGDKDKTTPLKDTMAFHEKLCELQFESQLIVLKDVAHAFILYNYRSSDDEVLDYMNQIYRYLMENK